MIQPTHFPSSFGGGDNLLLYFWALGSITALCVMNTMVFGYMARDIWRDRYTCHPRDSVSAFRWIFLISSLTGIMRTLPEAAYLYSWNEVREDQWRLILMVKRLADGLSIIPGTIAPALLIVSYPAICHALRINALYAPGDIPSLWHRLVRPLMAIAVAFVIAFLVAISKMYLGVNGGAH